MNKWQPNIFHLSIIKQYSIVDASMTNFKTRPRGLSESRLYDPAPEKCLADNRIQIQCLTTNSSDIFLSHSFALSQKKNTQRTSRPRAALKSLFLARDAGGPFGSPAAAPSSPGRPGGVPVPSSARLPIQHAPGPRTPGAVPSAPPRPKARASRHHPRAPCAQAPVTT